jgi:hypothetical protein
MAKTLIAGAAEVDITPDGPQFLGKNEENQRVLIAGGCFCGRAKPLE